MEIDVALPFSSVSAASDVSFGKMTTQLVVRFARRPLSRLNVVSISSTIVGREDRTLQASIPKLR